MATGYHPRRFDQSPLFQVVYHHFDHFREAYHRHYADYLGHLRPIVTHTINRFLLCGDPREGVARYDCPHCNHSVAVPFSCKTRLFCPSCHDLKTLLWIDAIQAELLLPVAHRFWTFSIPKRLRYYCLRNRKLLSLIVSAAVNTLAKSLTGGKLQLKLRPGIVALIQTHADSLDWNCHLHLVVTDGAVDYSNAATPTFKPCAFWDFTAMTEIFRFEVIEAMFKKGVLTPDVANNLVSWRHSGFHVHASSPFLPGDTELLRTRLAYAFRPPVALGRMDFDGATVTVRTQKKQLLKLSPIDFLAKLTTHIPDRYQNIRRYAGFYASVVQARVRRATMNAEGQANTCSLGIEPAKPICPKWAFLIAKIFGALPLACPRCNTVMELKVCITDPIAIAKAFPNSARAPPQITFDRYLPPANDIAYGKVGDGFPSEPTSEATDNNAHFNQAPPDDDAFFNQDCEG